MHLTTTAVLLAATAFSSAQAHTLFTNFFIDGTPQGDGTCVRMTDNIPQATSPLPVSSISTSDMACGVNGEHGVSRICSANAGSTMTVEFRSWPDGTHSGSIDISHKGPCAVYMKKVTDSSASNNAAGPGWFKIFNEDYDTTTNQWCTEKLIPNAGHLAVTLPSDLAPGYYLVRTELLALHQADKTPADPQFYVGCAQLFLKGSGSATPANTVSIPGYVSMQANAAALTFHIWDPKLALPFPTIGPAVYKSSGKRDVAVREAPLQQSKGLKPPNCILQNANWCGTELASYSDQQGCWAASTACSAQTTTCYSSAGPTGSKNCPIWEAKCSTIRDACNSGNYHGPPAAGKILTPAIASLSGGVVHDANGSGSTSSGGGSVSGGGSGGGGGGAVGGGGGGGGTAAVGGEGVSTCPAPPPGSSSSPGGVVGGSVDECGSRNASATCQVGLCCSDHGYCGTSDLYCTTGCQPEFGACHTGPHPKRSARLA